MAPSFRPAVVRECGASVLRPRVNSRSRQRQIADQAARPSGRKDVYVMCALDFRRAWAESLDMAHLARSRHRHTYAEYLEYERDSGLKHEFEDGEIFAMAGGSRRHNALASRISAALEASRARGCVAFQSDQKVRVLATGKATYPDASIVCGPIEGDPADPAGATITNPTLLVEVLSPSTEQDDRGSKWQHYQLIPSLREYVLVSQTEPRIECYRRLPSGNWEYIDATAGTLTLTTGAALDLAKLFDDLPA